MRARRGATALPAALMAVTAFVATLSGCGRAGSEAPAVPGAVAATPVLPAGAGAAQAVAGGATGDDSCNGGHPTASLPAESPLPEPGTMPARSYMAAIVRRGYLVAGVDQNTLLWGYRDPTTGKLAGFDIDMVNQVAEAIFGPLWVSHIHYVVVPNADRMTAVESGQVDIVAETMTITCAREQSVDFSTEYYDAGQEVLVPNGSPIKSVADLGGKTVCAASGSTSLTNLAALRPAPRLVSVVNQTDCLVMLQQGQVDAISTDDTILEGLAAQDPNTHLVPGVRLSDEPYGMAISKTHPDFTGFVNGVLARERADGTWASIWRHWLGSTIKTPVPAPPAAQYRSS